MKVINNGQYKHGRSVSPTRSDDGGLWLCYQGGVKDYLDAKETEMRARNSLLQALNTIERAKADQVTAIAKIKTERKFLNGERIVKPPICDSDAVIARLILDTADGIDHGLYEFITEPKKRLRRHIYTRRTK